MAWGGYGLSKLNPEKGKSESMAGSAALVVVCSHLLITALKETWRTAPKHCLRAPDSVAQTSQSEQVWHLAWSQCHSTTPLSSTNCLQQEPCVCKASLLTWLCQSPGCLPICVHHLQVILTHTTWPLNSFPALHPLASSSSLPGSLMTANPGSSSIQPVLQAYNSINRLKFLAPHLSQNISNFAPIALHHTAPLCLSAFAITSHSCQANHLTCALWFEGQCLWPQKQGGINRCDFFAARLLLSTGTAPARYYRGSLQGWTSSFAVKNNRLHLLWNRLFQHRLNKTRN